MKASNAKQNFLFFWVKEIPLVGVSIVVAYPTTGGISTMQKLRQTVLAEAKHQLKLNLICWICCTETRPWKHLRRGCTRTSSTSTYPNRLDYVREIACGRHHKQTLTFTPRSPYRTNRTLFFCNLP